jgi:hypothetical protein
VGIISELLDDVVLPKMVKVKQEFAASEIHDVTGILREEMNQAGIRERVTPGMRIAIAVGSRGMAEITLIVKFVVEELIRYGAIPFIVPAMGSHGGATAVGQVEMLASLGVTETSVGCPVISSMEVVKLGVLDNGLPVYIDKNAYEAAGIIIINRVKAHTAFSGTYESGLVKMMTIGLGKHKGAASCHALGFKHMAENIVNMAVVHLLSNKYLYGIGIVENAYDKIAQIAVIPAEKIFEAEPRLLADAKDNMPKILLQPFDVLIVDQLGKEFSGGGMDPHVTGNGPIPSKFRPARLVALDLTHRSHGNAIGIGNAHFTTRRFFDKIDFNSTYANVITATIVESARIPLIMPSDSLAIKGAVKTCKAPNIENVRIVRIKNTLHISDVSISENMLGEAEQHSSISIVGKPTTWNFDVNGNLSDIGTW